MQLRLSFSIFWDFRIWFYIHALVYRSFWFRISAFHQLYAKIFILYQQRYLVVYGARKSIVCQGYLPLLRSYARFCNPSRLRLVFSKTEQWLPCELNSSREVVNKKHLVQLIYLQNCSNNSQKMKLSIKDFLRKGDQIPRRLRILSHLLEKSLMGNSIFCAVQTSIAAQILLTFHKLSPMNWGE